MLYAGEIISLVVAVSWTITALFAEVASRSLGSLQFNVVRMLLSIVMLSATLWIFTGSPFPLYADGDAWLWLSLSGFVGYILGDYCLFNSYILIGSRFGQLFMTLAPIAAAFSGWAILGEKMSLQAVAGMLVTVSGIGLSVLNKGGGKHRLSLKLPLKGVLFGIGAGVGQGVGLVLSKVGMNYYEQSIPMGGDVSAGLMPFASTMIRAITGFVGFFVILLFQKKLSSLLAAAHNRKGMNAALWATFAGPFIGVSLSLMAVQYTEAGIASTLMALTPIFILWPSSFLFGQRVTVKEIIGAVISVVGVSLFFL